MSRHFASFLRGLDAQTRTVLVPVCMVSSFLKKLTLPRWLKLDIHTVLVISALLLVPVLPLSHALIMVVFLCRPQQIILKLLNRTEIKEYELDGLHYR